MVDQTYNNLEDIFGEDKPKIQTGIIDNTTDATNVQPDISVEFGEGKDNKIQSLDELLVEDPKPGSEEALAGYVGQEKLGEPGLDDVKLRGQISAADTIQEKLNEFKNAYPDGDLVFVPGKGTAISTLEGVPSAKKNGEILFRKDASQPYAKLDGRFFEGGGNEFLADLSEFLYDDLGVITGEILAGSKKMANFIKPFTKLLPGPVGAALTGYDLWGLLTRTALYSTAGEIAQEGVQEFRGINEQSFGEILDSAAFKGLVATGGTMVMEPVIRKFGDIFSGRGILKKSDESGEAVFAVKEINEILKDLDVKNKEGNTLQIAPLPANLMVDNPMVKIIGKQTAATGGLLSGQYRNINEALSKALQEVGDEKSASKLINLLDIATQLEKNRLLDIAHKTANGTFKFDDLNPAARDAILQRFGIKDINQLTFSDATEIISESIEMMTKPGGTLDIALKNSFDVLQKAKPDGIQFDLTKIKQISTKNSFGTTQAKKSLDGDPDDLEEIILNSFGQERLDVVDNKIQKIIDEYENPTNDIIQETTAREYKKYLNSMMGSDPLINIQQNGNVLERISNAFRDIGNEGVVNLPAGAGDGSTNTFDFLMNSRKQLMDIKHAPIGNVTRDQRSQAAELISEIDNTIKSPANADEGWKTAYDSLINLHDKQISLMNLPVVLSLAGKGNYSQLVKGYMSPSFTKQDVGLLFDVLDDKGIAAFKSGFINQLIGDSNKLVNLHKTLKEYDPDILKSVFDRPTVTALENLGGYMKILDDSGFAKTLETQSQFGRAIENLINKKDTKGIEAGLNFIKGQEGGFDSALGKSFHDGIINRLFTSSTQKVKGKLALNQGAYRKYVQNLKDTGIFESFPVKTQKLLEDIDLVKDFLVQAGDAGTSIEAASLGDAVKGVFSGRTDPTALVGVFAEIIGIGKLFTSSAGRAFLIGTAGKKEAKKQLKPSMVAKNIGSIISTLTLGKYGPDDQGISELKPLLNILPFVEGVAPVNEKQIKRDQQMQNQINMQENQIKEDRVSMTPTSINSASDRFANAMPSSLSMQETGPVNPNTMAKGSQLFSGPNEITFAAQGGIMNARKPIQRVA